MIDDFGSAFLMLSAILCCREHFGFVTEFVYHTSPRIFGIFTLDHVPALRGISGGIDILCGGAVVGNRPLEAKG